MKYMVTVKPVDEPGPVLVSDDPAVVRATLAAITRRYERADRAPLVAGRIGQAPPPGDT
jgi:hypothetical protein